MCELIIVLKESHTLCNAWVFQQGLLCENQTCPTLQSQWSLPASHSWWYVSRPCVLSVHSLMIQSTVEKKKKPRHFCPLKVSFCQPYPLRGLYKCLVSQLLLLSLGCDIRIWIHSELLDPELTVFVSKQPEATET